MQEQEWPEEAIDVWRGVAVGCRMCGCRVKFGGFQGWQTAGLDAHKKPLMCGLGVACQVSVLRFLRVWSVLRV